MGTDKKTNAVMWATIACIGIALLGLATETFGLVVLGVIAGAIAFFVVLPLMVHEKNKQEKHEAAEGEKQLWKMGVPVTTYLHPGHFEGAYEYEEWKEGYSDCAGGWDVRGGVKNISPYTINYVYLHVFPVDRIGNRVAKTESWKYTGPFKPGELQLVRSEHHWYDLSVATVETEKIVVEYANAGTQVTTALGSFFALHGHGMDQTWVAKSPESDGSWSVKGIIYYQADKPSNRVVMYVVPLDRNGNALAGAMECSSLSPKAKGDVRTVWWNGLWKGLPVAKVRIDKFTIEYTDGTKQTVEI